jgi:hypothetical protein
VTPPRLEFIGTKHERRIVDIVFVGAAALMFVAVLAMVAGCDALAGRRQ